MHLHRRYLGISLVAVVSLGLIWSTGCSDRMSNPSPDDQSTTLTWLRDSVSDGDDLWLTNTEPLADSTVLVDYSNVIGEDYELKSTDTIDVTAANGGTIAMRDLGDLNQIRIPDSSLESNTRISVNSYRPSNGTIKNELALVFGPSGLQFNSPITVELDASLFDDPSREGRPAEVTWQYYNTDLEAWEEYSRVTVSPDRIFRIPVEHFSTYRALATRYEMFSQGGQQ